VTVDDAGDDSAQEHDDGLLALAEAIPARQLMPVLDRLAGGRLPDLGTDRRRPVPEALVGAVLAHGRPEQLAALVGIPFPDEPKGPVALLRRCHLRLRRELLHRIAERVAGDAGLGELAYTVYTHPAAGPRTRHLLVRSVHTAALASRVAGDPEARPEHLRPLLVTGDPEIAWRIVTARGDTVTDPEQARAVLILLDHGRAGLLAEHLGERQEHASPRRLIRRHLSELMGLRKDGTPDGATAALRRLAGLLDAPAGRAALLRARPHDTGFVLHAACADDPGDAELIRRHLRRPLPIEAREGIAREATLGRPTVLALLRNGEPPRDGAERAAVLKSAFQLCREGILSHSELLLHTGPVGLLPEMVGDGSGVLKDGLRSELRTLLAGAAPEAVVAAARETRGRSLAQLLDGAAPAGLAGIAGGDAPAHCDIPLLHHLLLLIPPEAASAALALLTPAETLDVLRHHVSHPEPKLPLFDFADLRPPLGPQLPSPMDEIGPTAPGEFLAAAVRVRRDGDVQEHLFAALTEAESAAPEAVRARRYGGVALAEYLVRLRVPGAALHLHRTHGFGQLLSKNLDPFGLEATVNDLADRGELTSGDGLLLLARPHLHESNRLRGLRLAADRLTELTEQQINEIIAKAEAALDHPSLKLLAGHPAVPLAQAASAEAALARSTGAAPASDDGSTPLAFPGDPEETYTAALAAMRAAGFAALSTVTARFLRPDTPPEHREATQRAITQFAHEHVRSMTAAHLAAPAAGVPLADLVGPDPTWFAPTLEVPWEGLREHLAGGGTITLTAVLLLLGRVDIPEEVASLLISSNADRLHFQTSWSQPAILAALAHLSVIRRLTPEPHLPAPHGLTWLLDTGRITPAEVLNRAAPARMATVPDGTPASAALAEAARAHLGPEAAADPNLWAAAVRLYAEFAGSLGQLLDTAAAIVHKEANG
jgi:hypothetical protein